MAVTLRLDLVPISQGEQRLVPAQLKGSNLHKGVGRQEAGGKGLGSHSVSISSRSDKVKGVLTREEGGGHGEGRGGQGIAMLGGMVFQHMGRQCCRMHAC